MDSLLHDLRFALRSLRARPLFALGVLLTLAVGIGANTAMFSVADTVLRRPLPFADDHELVRVYLMRNGQPPWLSPQAPVLNAVRDRAVSFESVAGQRFTNVTLRTADGPARVVAGGLSEGWLETLGIEPMLGRGFTLQEERQGRASGVLLASHAFWQDRFGGSADLLGSTVVLDDAPYTVVGILPEGFAYPYANELYFPLDTRSGEGGAWGFNIQARLRDGTSLESALDELRQLSVQLRTDLDNFGPEFELTAIPIRRVLLDDQDDLVRGLFAAVGFLLLIACANVASLLLARSTARRREFALRAALGASRGRQVRQLVTESLVLSLAAGGLGLVIAAWTRDSLRALFPGRLANVVAEVPMDGGVFAFAMIASVLTGLLSGLPLSYRRSDVEPARVLRSGGRGGASRTELRWLDVFVVGELALVMTLLCGAGGMVAGLTRLASADLGFDSAGVYTLSVSLEGERYAEPERRRRFVSETLEALLGAMNVEAAGATTIFPSARRGNYLAGIHAPGAPDDVLQVNDRLVTPGFLETLSVPLLRGRLLDAADDETAAPVAVLSRRGAGVLFPDTDPIGAQITDVGQPGAPFTVVGVVEDVAEQYEVEATVYRPYAQHADRGQATNLVLTTRARNRGTDVIRAVRDAVWSVDPALPVFEPATATELHAETLAGRRFGTWLISGFAAAGLVLGVLGLYGLVALSVARRHAEIAVRMALGARPGAVVGAIVGAALRRAAIGAAIGTVGAFAALRAGASLLGSFGGLEPLVLIVVTVLLGGACLLASWIPARRAARLDPGTVLRAG